jgi:hypothetical protein
MAMSLDQMKQLQKRFEQLQHQFDEHAKKAKEFTATVAAHVPMKIQIDGILKDYKDAVKETNGLTSVKPAVISLLTKANAEPSEATLDAAEKAVAGHATEVVKANASSKDAQVRKRVEKFAKEMKELMARIEMHDRLI